MSTSAKIRLTGLCPRPECGRPMNPLLTGPQFSDGSPAPIDYIYPCDYPRDDLGREVIPDTLFVVVWDDGSITTANNRAVSNMYDMADCDHMDGVKSIHATDENCELVKIDVGPQRRDNSDFDSIYFATAPIMAGKRRVGTIHFTDH